MTNVTPNELRVLRALLTNHFTATNGQVPETYCGPDMWAWSNCIDDAGEPTGLEPRSIAALCGTLTQKGLVEADGKTGREACIRITKAGFEVAVAQGACA